MPIAPLITFKAGRCDGDFEADGPTKVTAVPTPGFLYLYSEDELIHFCWRARDQRLDNPEIDLVMVPTDGSFQPYLTKGAPIKKSPASGRIFVLKFQSSAQRYLFWLQSAAKDPSTPSFFSRGDLKLGDIVDRLLQGEDPESTVAELAAIRGNRRHEGGDDDEDDDDEMEDADNAAEGTSSTRDQRRGSGGAGADATGGDFREEGEDSREGGGDGARAVSSTNNLPSDANTAIQNFLNSLNADGPAAQQKSAGGGDTIEDTFTTLVDLLPSTTTIPMLASPTTTETFICNLLVKHLPPSLIYLAHDMDPADIPDDADSDPEAVAALADELDIEQQKDLLRRVLRSPQFHQALAQITQALRDGGLPAIAGAVGIEVEGNGYYNAAAGIPMNGGKAVKVFLEGAKKSVDAEKKG